MKKINLVTDTIDKNDIDKLIEWLKKYPRLTKGDLTWELEKKFAEWLGVKYSVFVNSGSSANLMMLYSLEVRGLIKKGDTVVLPTLSWATDFAPIVQLGYHPIFCEVNPVDFSVDIHQLKAIFEVYSPKVLLLVSVLGFVPNMKKIMEVCFEHGVILLEDTCESMGSEYQGWKLGTFGLMSSFSTYFGHHISTIEGGFVCTNDKELYNILLSIRSHGWSRDMEKDVGDKLKIENKIDEFHNLYTFYYPGFNLRSTDLQAFIGLNQLEKLNDIVRVRNENYKTYVEYFGVAFNYQESNNDIFISNFAFPIRITPGLIERFKENNIECRPFISGNMARQPMSINHLPELRFKKYLFSDELHDNWCYLPNHHDLTKDDIKYIWDVYSAK